MAADTSESTLRRASPGPTRRDFVIISAGAFAAVGAAASLWPFVDQMNPDATTLAVATIELDLAPIAVGQAVTVNWQGKPVFVRHRTAEEIERALAEDVAGLPDRYARNDNLPSHAPATDANRVTAAGDTVREQWLVMIGICTHLGCVPLGQRVGQARGDYGGWFCPCHGSHYDTAGRIRRGPAPRNLHVPPFTYLTDTRIRIG